MQHLTGVDCTWPAFCHCSSMQMQIGIIRSSFLPGPPAFKCNVSWPSATCFFTSVFRENLRSYKLDAWASRACPGTMRKSRHKMSPSSHRLLCIVLINYLHVKPPDPLRKGPEPSPPKHPIYTSQGCWDDDYDIIPKNNRLSRTLLCWKIMIFFRRLLS